MTGKINFDFSGTVVIVTGAARGIGREMTQAFTAAGASVLAVDRDEAGLIETCEGLGPACASMTADIRFAEETVHVVNTAVKTFGSLDVCINNAAVAPHTSLLEERVEVWDTVYSVNCRGPF